jgi:hypothetical protein
MCTVCVSQLWGPIKTSATENQKKKKKSQKAKEFFVFSVDSLVDLSVALFFFAEKSRRPNRKELRCRNTGLTLLFISFENAPPLRFSRPYFITETPKSIQFPSTTDGLFVNILCCPRTFIFSFFFFSFSLSDRLLFLYALV